MNDIKRNATIRKATPVAPHLFLTIFTAGMWGIFVWLPLFLWRKYTPSQTIRL